MALRRLRHTFLGPLRTCYTCVARGRFAHNPYERSPTLISHCWCRRRTALAHHHDALWPRHQSSMAPRNGLYGKTSPSARSARMVPKTACMMGGRVPVVLRGRAIKDCCAPAENLDSFLEVLRCGQCGRWPAVLPMQGRSVREQPDGRLGPPAWGPWAGRGRVCVVSAVCQARGAGAALRT